MSEIPTIRRKSLFTDLQPALVWLTSIGIDITKGRISHYVKCIKKLENQNPSLPKLTDETYDSAIEANDLVVIHKGLSQFNGNEIIVRIKDYLSGPIHAIDERFDKGSSHKARSTALELLVASQFALAGYSISFDTEADVEVIDKTVLFHVECKRPSKYENFGKCVGDAYSQLKKRYTSYKGDLKQRGFAFISITKLVNPDNGTLLLKNKLEIKERLDALASNYLTENKHLFYKNLDDRTMGVIFYLQMAIKIPEYNGLFIYRHLAGIYVSKTNDPNIENQNPDRVYFREIMTKLNQGFVSIFSDK